jgi:hypothetical protein
MRLGIMEGEKDKFAAISKIYPQFTEENKENLFMTAVNLLEVQKKDAEILALNESEKQGVCSV